MAAIKTWPQLAIVYVSLTVHFASVTSQYETYVCSTNNSYSRESSYRADLNTLLASLSSNIANTGFHHSSVGEANAVALCRPDIQLSTCRGCIKIAAEDILVQCPDQYEAIIWYAYCILRYSNQPIFGTLTLDPQRILSNEVDDLRSPQVRGMLLDGLRANAANGGPLVKAAAGNRTAGFNQTIFALVQCTPDLSPENCSSCLDRAAGEIPACCDSSIGVRIYTPSCTIRYEVYNFYNLTKLQELKAVPWSLPPFSSPAAGNDGDDKIRNIIIIVVSIVALLTLGFFVGFFLRKRVKHKTTEDSKVGSEHVVVEIRTVESIQYDFEKIKAATNNFSHANTLGQGGFGIVYKGKLENGRKIAVKRLSKDSRQGDLEFKNEVLLLARLQHRNLVKLLGFTIKGIERLLVYEFVHNGSLDRFIFGCGIKCSNLDWEKRYKIIGGVARGVLYLYEDSRLQIIHRDLKASNVLLDEEMNPKISDFGLAKLVVPNENLLYASRIVGTYGYMAPEYANQGHFSIKLDVYSFGVLVLEIVSGQRNTFFQNEHDSGDLLACAWRNWREGRGADMIDRVLMGNSSGTLQLEEMLRCIHIALLCVQQNPDDRPTMAGVVLMLNSFSLSLPFPSEPGFYIHTSFSNVAASFA
ncbi:hypothetical protein C2S51_016155 [Perilla frutescens var. frutescens]|nr:hypothetical protein C2S51_016155 [Perilla frutescens var. frutescens]